MKTNKIKPCKFSLFRSQNKNSGKEQLCDELLLCVQGTESFKCLKYRLEFFPESSSHVNHSHKLELERFYKLKNSYAFNISCIILTKL